MKQLISTLIVLTLVSCVPGMSNKDRTIFAKEHPKSLQQLDTAFGQLEYVETGNRNQPLLVFVHGSPGGWHAFAGFLKKAALQQDYMMVAVDRPGYGGSSAGKPERSLKKQAGRIKSVVEKYKDNRPIIMVGHSYGGPVIARLAIDDPSLVDGLVMIAASVDPDLEKTKWIQYIGNWGVFRWILPDAIDVCNQEILALKHELVQLENAWQTIRIPTAIVHGKKDGLVPYDNVDFMLKTLTNAPTKVFDDSDLNHFVPWKRPELIEQAIVWTLTQILDKQ